MSEKPALGSCDDYDIYSDLPNIEPQQTLLALQDENQNLKEQVSSLRAEVQSLQSKMTSLKASNHNLSCNISVLFKTAVAENERKDATITELRKELDNILFRRNKKNSKCAPVEPQRKETCRPENIFTSSDKEEKKDAECKVSDYTKRATSKQKIHSSDVMPSNIEKLGKNKPIKSERLETYEKTLSNPKEDHTHTKTPENVTSRLGKEGRENVQSRYGDEGRKDIKSRLGYRVTTSSSLGSEEKSNSKSENEKREGIKSRLGIGVNKSIKSRLGIVEKESVKLTSGNDRASQESSQEIEERENVKSKFKSEIKNLPSRQRDEKKENIKSRLGKPRRHSVPKSDDLPTGKNSSVSSPDSNKENNDHRLMKNFPEEKVSSKESIQGTFRSDNVIANNPAHFKDTLLPESLMSMGDLNNHDPTRNGTLLPLPESNPADPNNLASMADGTAAPECRNSLSNLQTLLSSNDSTVLCKSLKRTADSRNTEEKGSYQESLHEGLSQIEDRAGVDRMNVENAEDIESGQSSVPEVGTPVCPPLPMGEPAPLPPLPCGPPPPTPQKQNENIIAGHAHLDNCDFVTRGETSESVSTSEIPIIVTNNSKAPQQAENKSKTGDSPNIQFPFKSRRRVTAVIVIDSLDNMSDTAGQSSGKSSIHETPRHYSSSNQRNSAPFLSSSLSHKPSGRKEEPPESRRLSDSRLSSRLFYNNRHSTSVKLPSHTPERRSPSELLNRNSCRIERVSHQDEMHMRIRDRRSRSLSPPRRYDRFEKLRKKEYYWDSRRETSRHSFMKEDHATHRRKDSKSFCEPRSPPIERRFTRSRANLKSEIAKNTASQRDDISIRTRSAQSSSNLVKSKGKASAKRENKDMSQAACPNEQAHEPQHTLSEKKVEASKKLSKRRKSQDNQIASHPCSSLDDAPSQCLEETDPNTQLAERNTPLYFREQANKSDSRDCSGDECFSESEESTSSAGSDVSYKPRYSQKRKRKKDVKQYSKRRII